MYDKKRIQWKKDRKDQNEKDHDSLHELNDGRSIDDELNGLLGVESPRHREEDYNTDASKYFKHFYFLKKKFLINILFTTENKV